MASESASWSWSWKRSSSSWASACRLIASRPAKATKRSATRCPTSATVGAGRTVDSGGGGVEQAPGCVTDELRAAIGAQEYRRDPRRDEDVHDAGDGRRG